MLLASGQGCTGLWCVAPSSRRGGCDRTQLFVAGCQCHFPCRDLYTGQEPGHQCSPRGGSLAAYQGSDSATADVCLLLLFMLCAMDVLHARCVAFHACHVKLPIQADRYGTVCLSFILCSVLAGVCRGDGSLLEETQDTVVPRGRTPRMELRFTGLARSGVV